MEEHDYFSGFNKGTNWKLNQKHHSRAPLVRLWHGDVSLMSIIWNICKLLLRVILTIHHVFSCFRLPAPHRSRWSSATPWITTATRRRTLSPPPPPPATTHPRGWSPATTASPQSTITISTATSRTVTACPTVGQASRRASLPLNTHLTTTPQTIHTPVLWKRTILRGICRWAPKCVTMYYDATFSSIVCVFWL